MRRQLNIKGGAEILLTCQVDSAFHNFDEFSDQYQPKAGARFVFSSFSAFCVKREELFLLLRIHANPTVLNHKKYRIIVRAFSPDSNGTFPGGEFDGI